MSSVLCAKCGHTAANDVELPTTPVPDLLHGNHVASGSQTGMIRDTITTAGSSISQLAGEITRLWDVIDGLKHKRDALEIYIQSHMGPLAAARRLPPEFCRRYFSNAKIQHHSTISIHITLHLDLTRCPCFSGVSVADGGPLLYQHRDCGHHLRLPFGQSIWRLMWHWPLLGSKEQEHAPYPSGLPAAATITTACSH
jgi:hypothetical protein